jgi:hypothetical protein
VAVPGGLMEFDENKEEEKTRSIVNGFSEMVRNFE